MPSVMRRNPVRELIQKMPRRAGFRVEAFSPSSHPRDPQSDGSLEPVWSQGGFNYDGVTNVFDLVGINTAGAYGQGSYLPTASAAARAAAVNENPSGGPLLDHQIPGCPDAVRGLPTNSPHAGFRSSFRRRARSMALPQGLSQAFPNCVALLSGS